MWIFVGKWYFCEEEVKKEKEKAKERKNDDIFEEKPKSFLIAVAHQNRPRQKPSLRPDLFQPILQPIRSPGPRSRSTAAYPAAHPLQQPTARPSSPKPSRPVFLNPAAPVQPLTWSAQLPAALSRSKTTQFQISRIYTKYGIFRSFDKTMDAFFSLSFLWHFQVSLQLYGFLFPLFCNNCSKCHSMHIIWFCDFLFIL